MSLPTLVTAAPAPVATAVAVPSAAVLDLDTLLDPTATWYVL